MTALEKMPGRISFLRSHRYQLFKIWSARFKVLHMVSPGQLHSLLQENSEKFMKIPMEKHSSKPQVKFIHPLEKMKMASFSISI